MSLADRMYDGYHIHQRSDAQGVKRNYIPRAAKLVKKTPKIAPSRQVAYNNRAPAALQGGRL